MKQVFFMAVILLSMNLHAETRFQACVNTCQDQFGPSMQALKDEGADLYNRISKSSNEAERSSLTSKYYWIANKHGVLQAKKMTCLKSCED